MRLEILTLLGLASASVARMEAQVPFRNGNVTSGTLSFDGHATAGDFTGNTAVVTGHVSGASLEASEGWVEAPITTLKTGNDHRDRDLNKSMESEKYPTIRFELHDVTQGATAGDSTTVTLHGRFLIHGVTRPVALPATLAMRSGGVHLTSSFPLNLKDYEIGGLSKMLGMLKMYPDIVVHVDLNIDEAKTDQN